MNLENICGDGNLNIARLKLIKLGLRFFSDMVTVLCNKGGKNNEWRNFRNAKLKETQIFQLSWNSFVFCITSRTILVDKDQGNISEGF